MAPSHLTFGDHKRSSPCYTDFKASRKGVQLDPMFILLTGNRKPYMGRPMTAAHLTLSDLERPSHCHPDSEPLYLIKELR